MLKVAALPGTSVDAIGAKEQGVLYITFIQGADQAIYTCQSYRFGRRRLSAHQIANDAMTLTAISVAHSDGRLLRTPSSNPIFKPYLLYRHDEKETLLSGK